MNKWIITLTGDNDACRKFVARLSQYGFLKIPIAYFDESVDAYDFLLAFVVHNSGRNIVMNGFNLDDIREEDFKKTSHKFVNIIFDAFEGRDYAKRNASKCEVIVVDDPDQDIERVWQHITKRLSNIR